MSKRFYLLIYCCGVIAASVIVFWQHSAGYMDAEYYYGVGQQIAKGEYYEPFIWNYLNSPTELPVTPNTYWMPLSSIIAAAGMMLTNSQGFLSARIPFICLAGLPGVLSAWIAWRISRSHRSARMAGILGIGGGFYFPYMTMTDTFLLYMVFGAGAIILFQLLYATSQARRGVSGGLAFSLGVICGLMHLTRADGLIWLAGAIAGLLLARRKTVWKHIGLILLVVAGYLIPMGWWYGRNLDVFGSLFPPGNSRNLWLTDYDQIVTLYPEQLTFITWKAQGWGNIISDRLKAAGTNLTSTVAVQGMIFIVPLILVGAWKYRRDRMVWAGMGMWLATFFIMSFVFPYAGSRGGFFHSGAATQPILWALGAIGLEESIHWAGQKRKWNIEQAWKVFSMAGIMLAGMLTGFVAVNRLGVDGNRWNRGEIRAQQIEQTLKQIGAAPEDRVIINNPVGYYVATGRWSIVMPDGGPRESIAAGEKFNARYLVLEENHVRGFASVWVDPTNSIPSGMEYAGGGEGYYIYRFIFGE